MRMDDFLQALFADARKSPEAVKRYFRIFEEAQARGNAHAAENQGYGSQFGSHPLAREARTPVRTTHTIPERRGENDR